MGMSRRAGQPDPGQGSPRQVACAQFSDTPFPIGGTLSVFFAATVFFLLQQPRSNVPIRTGEFFSIGGSYFRTFRHLLAHPKHHLVGFLWADFLWPISGADSRVPQAACWRSFALSR